MWMTDNETAYAAERNWVRDERGRHHWIVAVRATFVVDPRGKLALADEQPPPALDPEYVGDPAESSLRWDSDLLYVKPCTDVIAEAHAHAPHGRPVTSRHLRLRVGPVHKEIVVHGDRRYERGPVGLRTTPPHPFTCKPVVYEAAFGGTDTSSEDPREHGIDARNPIGRGFSMNPRHLAGTMAPSIAYPNRNIARAGPAGFGPIAPSWQPRRALAGTYNEQWARQRRPLLPTDYDPLFASCAPEDQRPRRHLRGGEPVELVGMHAEGDIRFDLPKIRLAFTTHFGRRRRHHQGRLVTVLLRPEERQVSMVWQTSIVVAPQDGDYLDRTVVTEKPYR
jgi:hypothetical protein